MASAWPDHHITRLKKLYGEGYSYGQCMKLLNREFGTEYTRNAIGRQVDRLNLPKRGKESTKGKYRRKKRRSPPSRPMPTANGQSTAGTPRTAWGRNRGDNGAFHQIEIRDISLEPGTDSAVTLTELGPHHCRWPVGEATAENQKFCGHRREDGKPYCEHHRALAYESPSSRQRRSQKRRAEAVDRQAKARQYPSSGISRAFIDTDMEDWI